MATLLWLQAGACSGNTISLLQAEEPTVVDLLTDFGVELLWHPSLGPELGEAVQAILADLVSGAKPLDIFVVEGTVVQGPNGTGRMDMFAGRPMTDWITDLTSVASIVVGVGDCAAFACAYAGGQVMRVESVQNANDMATCVAKDICGQGAPYHAFPWFWSNQFDLRLQTAGINAGYDATVVRGDPEARSFSVVYLKEGKVVALDCVNATKDYVQGRKLVEAGASPDLAELADAEKPLKELL